MTENRTTFARLQLEMLELSRAFHQALEIHPRVISSMREVEAAADGVSAAVTTRTAAEHQVRLVKDEVVACTPELQVMYQELQQNKLQLADLEVEMKQLRHALSAATVAAAPPYVLTLFFGIALIR